LAEKIEKLSSATQWNRGLAFVGWQMKPVNSSGRGWTEIANVFLGQQLRITAGGQAALRCKGFRENLFPFRSFFWVQARRQRRDRIKRSGLGGTFVDCNES
jgi:hypothetical protein